MGYDIHITRRKSWSDDEGPEITLDEWRAIVCGDEDLKALPPTSENPLVAAMSSPHGECSAARYFYYLGGQIFVKNPCKAVLLKMLAIASALNARVVGEEDEVYAEDGSPTSPTSYVVNDNW